MQTNKLKLIEIAALAMSAVVTVLAMLRAAAWQIDAGGLLFLIWAISPYLFVYSLGILVDKFTAIPRKSLVFCLTAVLMLAFTLLAYVGTLGDESSTYALIFLFVPVYLYIGGIVVLTVGLILSWLFGGREKETLR